METADRDTGHLHLVSAALAVVANACEACLTVKQVRDLMLSECGVVDAGHVAQSTGGQMTNNPPAGGDDRDRDEPERRRPLGVIVTDLAFKHSEEDLVRFPWLREKTRKYCMEEYLGEGRVGRTYWGYPLQQDGETVWPNAPMVVIKEPIIYVGKYNAADNRERLERIRTKNTIEINHLRKNLPDSEYANFILDAANLNTDDLQLHYTVQLYLEHSVDLNAWLQKNHPKRGTNWNGIGERKKWLEIAIPIAKAIKELHSARVRHGDIHPGNIFIRREPPYTATLIDFGEGFAAIPDLVFRELNSKPHFAPERLEHRVPINEQVDVYAFGILLLYLATGVSQTLDFNDNRSNPRSRIHDLIQKANPGLDADEPCISDIIARSTSADPTERPRMVDICRMLADIESSHSISSDVLVRTSSMLEGLGEQIQPHSNRPVLLGLLDHQVRELSHTFSGLHTEMVELHGSRNQMLGNLAYLMNHLNAGDSWTTPTTLSVWQKRALGLDGTYMSANIHALQRGASIRRVFIISVEELGADFVEHLASKLEQSNEKPLIELSNAFTKAMFLYKSISKGTKDKPYRPPSQLLVKWHQTCFAEVMESLSDSIRSWRLGGFLTTDTKIDFESALADNVTDSKPYLISICPVATLTNVAECREKNPVALMHLPKELTTSGQWLLVSAEIRGRVQRVGDFEPPHLIGMRVFNSVQDYPIDRINYLMELFNGSRKFDGSINVGTVLQSLSKCIRDCLSDVPSS